MLWSSSPMTWPHPIVYTWCTGPVSCVLEDSKRVLVIEVHPALLNGRVWLWDYFFDSHDLLPASLLLELIIYFVFSFIDTGVCTTNISWSTQQRYGSTCCCWWLLITCTSGQDVCIRSMSTVALYTYFVSNLFPFCSVCASQVHSSAPVSPFCLSYLVIPNIQSSRKCRLS